MPWPLIVFGIIILVIRAVSSANKGSTQQPPPMRPLARKPEQEERVHWEASSEQIDRFLDREPSPPARPQPPMLGRTAPRPPVPQQYRRPTTPQPPMPGRVAPPQRPISPLQQMLQMPAQIAEAQREVAHERQQIARERQQMAQQMREIERRRQAIEAFAQQQPKQTTGPARPVARGRVPAKTLLRDPADLRRAIVLAEALGPAKALRNAHRNRGGII